MGENRSGDNWTKHQDVGGGIDDKNPATSPETGVGGVEESGKPVLEDKDGHQENSPQKEDRISDFYFTILNFSKGIEKKPGESNESFERRKVRREKQFQVAVASIQEKWGIDVALPGALEQVKAIVKAEIAQSVQNASLRDRRRAQKKLLKISGIPSSRKSNEDGREMFGATPEVQISGLANLVARGDAEAGLQLLGLRYDLTQKEMGWIRLIADRNKIAPLIELVLEDGVSADKARERLKKFYRIVGSNEKLEEIMRNREGAAADAEDRLERLFGIAGAAEILKQIEKL